MVTKRAIGVTAFGVTARPLGNLSGIQRRGRSRAPGFSRAPRKTSRILPSLQTATPKAVPTRDGSVTIIPN